MGFLENLAKGFVRSAVNQVGRDTGKVVSNKIYGDAHATPIRNVSRSGNSFYYDNTKEEISEEELKKMLKDEGYKPQYINHGLLYHILSLVGLFIWAFFLSEIPVAYIAITILIAGDKFIEIPNVSFAKKESVPIYSRDRRYKRGYRIDGYTKETVKYKMPATANQKKINIVLSFVYLFICSVVTYYGVIIGNYSHHYLVLSDHEKFLEDSAKTRNEIELLKEQDTLLYNAKIKEFNEKYLEAVEYIKRSDSIPKY